MIPERSEPTYVMPHATRGPDTALREAARRLRGRVEALYAAAETAVGPSAQLARSLLVD